MSEQSANAGLVVLVGAGPAGTGLLTAEAAKWLSRADTIVYDRLVAAEALSLAPPHAERIYVGKSPGGGTDQNRINTLLIEKARAGRLVVRLKGGDPLLFGRGGEEAKALAAADVCYRIVPGVTAALAAAAYAGIPLTHRRLSSAVALVTAHEDPDKGASSLDWSALARIDTLVFYMGVSSLSDVAADLIRHGRPPGTPAAIVERAGLPGQRTVRASLERLPRAAAEAGIAAPAVIIVGQVAALRESLAWFEKLPLFGRTVLVTRAAEQAAELSEALSEMGAEVIAAPTIRIAEPESWGPLDEALSRLAEFDWLVLTSPNGVRAVMHRLEARDHDARALAPVRLAAVGPATAEELRAHGLRADLTPPDFTTASLARALEQAGAAGRRALLARAQTVPPYLADAMRSAGWSVHQVGAYRALRPDALPPPAVEALASRRVTWVTFTSASTVDNFISLAAGADLSGVKLAAIGPVTADAIRRHGLRPAVVAEPHTVQALVSAIVAREKTA